MTCWFSFLLFLSGAQAVACVLLLALRKPQSRVLRYTKTIVVVALISNLTACLICAYCLFTVPSGIALALALVFLLCGSLLLYVYCRWRVAYGNGQFEVRPCVGHKRVYSMGEVCGVTEGASATTLHLQNGKLRLDRFVRNREDFIEETEWYYRSVLHKGYALPDVPDKLFHGYVKNPWSFVVLFLFLNLFFLGCVVASLCLTFAEMYPMPDELASVVLTDYSVQWEDDSLQLLSPELRQPYYLNHVKGALPEARYSALCSVLSQTEPLVVFVERENYEDAKQNDCNYLKIKGLNSQNGKALVSQEEVANSVWLGARTGLIAVTVILFLVFAFEGVFFHVINHAPQYPRLFRLLVKEEWRNI